MRFRDLVIDTVTTLWTHKLRTFLTMFGIVWGVVSIVLMVALAGTVYFSRTETLVPKPREQEPTAVAPEKVEAAPPPKVNVSGVLLEELPSQIAMPA